MMADAVFVTDYMKLGIMQKEIPEIKADEVLIKTMACGLCCWDSWLYRGVNVPGPMPYAIGHEGAGIVEKVGSLVDNVKVGDKVFAASGSNEMMVEYFVNKADGVVKLPDDTTDWAAVIYEPTCCMVNLLNITKIRMGDHVVMVGAGYMGLLALQGLTNASQAGRITVFELREDRRKMAQVINPEIEVLDPESKEGKDIIQEIQDKGGADVCIDLGASDNGFHLADSMTKEAGKLVIGSFHRGEVTFDGTKWHLGGLNVYNLAPMSNPHYTEVLPRTLTMIEKGVFNPASLVSHTAYYKDVEELENMFQRSCDKEDGYMKGVILFAK